MECPRRTRPVSPTTTIPPLGMTGPVEHMGPVGICPQQLLAENWLIFGTTFLRKVCIPCRPSMMELLKTCWKTAGNPWGEYLAIFRQKDQISGISSSKSTLCRTENTTNLVFIPCTCYSGFPGGFLRISGCYITLLRGLTIDSIVQNFGFFFQRH